MFQLLCNCVAQVSNFVGTVFGTVYVFFHNLLGFVLERFGTVSEHVRNFCGTLLKLSCDFSKLFWNVYKYENTLLHCLAVLCFPKY